MRSPQARVNARGNKVSPGRRTQCPRGWALPLGPHLGSTHAVEQNAERPVEDWAWVCYALPSHSEHALQPKKTLVRCPTTGRLEACARGPSIKAARNGRPGGGRMYKELSSPPLSFACLRALPSSSHPSALPCLPLFCLPPVLAPFFLPHSLLSPASTLLSHSSFPPPTPCSSLSLLPPLFSLLSSPSALLSLFLPTSFCPLNLFLPHVNCFVSFPHQHLTHSPKYPSHPQYSPHTPLQSPSRS